MSSPHQLRDLTPRALERLLADDPPLLLPVGTVEWHSHHLPLGLDGTKAETIARTAAELCNGIVAPTVWWAVGGVDYPYTLQLSGDTVTPVLTEALRQYVGFGFRVVVIVNGHYGLDNSVAVRQAALSSTADEQAVVLPLADYELLLSLGARGDHAGVWETSLLWAVRPDLVATDALTDGGELPGVIGDDPRGSASPERGAAGIAHAARTIADVIRAARSLDSEGRTRLREAQQAGLQALEHLQELRRRLGRAQAPPVLTDSWFAYLQALLAGQYADAIEHAAEKLRDPSS